MYDLTTTKAEPIITAPKIILYGKPGVGKTHFAANAPEPFFLDTEGSAKKFAVAKQRITNYTDFDGWLTSIEKNNHNYKTLVIDTADWLEQIIHKKICKDYNAKEITDKRNDATGYGNGYIKSMNMLKDICERLDDLITKRNMAIIITSHSLIKKIDEPDGAAYDTYTLKTHDKFASILVEWSDAVLFAKDITLLDSKGKAIQGNKVLVTCGSKAATAKNRLDLPPEIPMSWQDFVSAIGTYKPE